VPHEKLKAGEVCPACGKGKVYAMADPKILVRVTGIAPLNATVTELERLRCNACGDVFTARAPEGLGAKKYDESVASLIGLMKYTAGVPFNRLEKLQAALGMPVPSSTQWELVDAGAALMAPAYQELVSQAAQGELLHNDDTTMKILELMGKRRVKAIAAGELDASERKGIFTSGIVSTGASNRDAPQIVLFFTGTQHAGENLADLLKARAPELTAPIQMCDALSSNMKPRSKKVLAHCLAHARRRFVDVVEAFPEECKVVLEALSEVYKVDDTAKKRNLSPDERLALHIEHSGPHLAELKAWMKAQLEEKKVEPNSGLGHAIEYTLKHWDALTLFLREPGAPLDNNVCERALKRVILHRKNAYFYKTKNGARVGDLYMSLVYTAEQCGASPLDYLNALQVHHEELARDPAAWMPWNYTEALAGLETNGHGSA
jgi:transposase